MKRPTKAADLEDPDETSPLISAPVASTENDEKENENVPEGKLSVLYWSWFVAKAILLIFLVILPFIFYTPAEIASLWYVPIMGIVAAALPSGGAPIAGGIVFLPVLTINGLSASQAVAFSAATQM
eukprot:CAMPEP_0113943668 /NCGR_PEP_ID=MMETSP1339-20121228/26962_1 /TAXON_ID=94617 /ORGANISM="Fibrocapsa japonica" /LENGTH=125 /DNA_ID=CAMNT_0000948607 /DNA_START=30 /DNA_END=404 /DNA_ORIENTATION=- /assembly_acc=CAM_ASM_000762